MKKMVPSGASQFAVALCIASLFAVLCAKGHAYLLPSDQIIEFMAKNFSRLQTLVVDQSTSCEDLEDENSAVVFKETISIKSPDLYSRKVLDQRMEGRSILDQRYRQLLIKNEPERLLELLSAMGVDLKKVSFTRIDGVIAYCIGDRDAASPKILVQKENFLPLLLSYKVRGQSSEERIRVRFKDYREIGSGWYPFEIVSSSRGRIVEKYRVRSIRVNEPLEPSTFKVFAPITEQGSSQEKKQVSPQDENLKELIKTFEEKYSQ